MSVFVIAIQSAYDRRHDRQTDDGLKVTAQIGRCYLHYYGSSSVPPLVRSGDRPSVSGWEPTNRRGGGGMMMGLMELYVVRLGQC